MAPRKDKAADRQSTASALPADIQYRTKADIARQHIQELIISGGVRAGDRITTREISDALGMSETPVREAMRGLAAEGWLDLHAHMGGVVTSIHTEQLAEIYAIRGVLGATAIQFGGALYTKKQLAELDRNLQQAEAAVAAEDVPRFARLNRQFHTLLVDTPNTQWSLKLLNIMWAQTAAVGRGFELVPGRIERAFNEHRQIVRAIGKRDFDLAARLLNEHERRAGAELTAALERQHKSAKT